MIGAATVLAAVDASAGQIPLSAISFSGGVELAPPSVLTAVEILSFSNTRPTLGTGIFSGVNTALFATFTPFVFDPAPALPFELWTFTDPGLNGGLGITAKLEVDGGSITHSTTTGAGLTTLNIFGTGTMTATGYDPTQASWSMSITEAGTTFALANSNVALPTPDGGTALGMMGAAFLGLSLMRRK